MSIRLGSFVAIVLTLSLLVGCGSVSKNSDPVKVGGTVTNKDGKPVDNVQICFAPLSANQLPGQYPVEKGKFSGNLIPGKYTFYFEPGKNATAINAIPESYRQNSADHTIEVTGATENLEVKLN